MSVAKVIEITASSNKGFEDAIEKGVKRACDTVEDVKGVWINEQTCTVKNGKIEEYRVNMRVTFVLK